MVMTFLPPPPVRALELALEPEIIHGSGHAFTHLEGFVFAKDQYRGFSRPRLSLRSEARESERDPLLHPHRCPLAEVHPRAEPLPTHHRPYVSTSHNPAGHNHAYEFGMLPLITLIYRTACCVHF